MLAGATQAPLGHTLGSSWTRKVLMLSASVPWPVSAFVCMSALLRKLGSSSNLSQWPGQGLTLKRPQERLFGGTEVTVLTSLRAGF